MRIWNVETGQLMQTLEGHLDRVNAVCYSEDGQLIASGSSDGSVKIWIGESNTISQAVEGRKSSILAIAFSPCG